MPTPWSMSSDAAVCRSEYGTAPLIPARAATRANTLGTLLGSSGVPTSDAQHEALVVPALAVGALAVLTGPELLKMADVFRVRTVLPDAFEVLL